MKAFAMVMTLLLGVALMAGEALAAGNDREAPRAQPSAVPTAEQEYSRGIAAKNAKNWTAAVGSFQKAVGLKPAFPEAWNELGFARACGRRPQDPRAPQAARRGPGRRAFRSHRQGQIAADRNGGSPSPAGDAPSEAGLTREA